MKKQYILFLLALTTALSLTACGNTSQNASAGVSTEVETEVNVSEVVTESTETESIEPTEIVEETEVTIIGEENSDEEGIPDLENYFETHEFVGYNDSYKCVKGDPRYEIVDGCYKGVPLKGSTLEESWEDMVVWISPSGVEIKINDKYSYLATKKDIVGRDYALWYKDPDRDLEPGSEWMEASKEFVYNENGDTTKVERNKYGAVDLSALPYVSTTTEKRDSFELTDELKTYAEQWEMYNNYQLGGTMELNPINMLQITENFANPVMYGQYNTWQIKREDGYWKVTFYRLPDELSWHGFLTCLKNINPDAELLYDVIYEQVYHGSDRLPKEGEYYNFGDSYLMGKNGDGECYFYIK